MSSWPPCPRCGAPVDATTRTCEEGHEVTSDHLIGVASTIDNAAHEVDRRSGRPSHDESSAELRDSLTGKKFGKYVLVAVIGRGGMGAVYRARHEELGHFAAIKVIERRLVGSQEIISRLFREARAAAQIGHTNIVQVFDFGRDPEIGGYIVMELLKGSSLEEVLAKERRLEESRLRVIALEICDALSAAHAKGIVHRDLKPANVFLQETARGELAKVMDFGIAKVAESLGESATQPGTIVGTPRYMSPEQWCSEPVDARSDVYSLGVMLYRMATGALPHPNATSLPQLARAVTQKLQPLPRAVHPTVSEALEALILKCCEPEKENRYASMDEIAQALRGLSMTETSPGAGQTSLRSRALGLGAIAAAVIVGGLIVSWLSKTPQMPRPEDGTQQQQQQTTPTPMPTTPTPMPTTPTPMPTTPTPTTPTPALSSSALIAPSSIASAAAPLAARPTKDGGVATAPIVPIVPQKRPPRPPPTAPSASHRPSDLLFGN